MPDIKVLNVAEKPSVARALAGVFKNMPQSRERAMRRDAAQIFEHDNVCFPRIFLQGNGQTMEGPIGSHSMITTSVRGHLASQDFPPEYGWSKVNPQILFEAPIETAYKDDMAALARMLGNLARGCQAVILWLDCDREGECIADEVREVCSNANQRLRFFRAKFSTVMAPEILRALKSLDAVNENFVKAVQARSELDLRVGAAFTRFQTLRLQKRFSGFSDKGVVSYGGCQFPTLGFIVERWARIETFREEDFWSLQLTLQLPDIINVNNNNDAEGTPQNNQNGNTRPITFTWKRGRLFDRLFTLILYESCLDIGEATVTQLRGNPKNKWRPVPLSTVELQKRASRYLRIGSETLMTAAEELYQNGFISYPRTETEIFRMEFQHRELIQDLAGNAGEFREYASKLLTDNNFQNPRAGRNDDKAHPPITPCKAVDPNTIPDPTQRSIYKLIVKHYLACCSRDAVGRETQLTVRIGTEEFTAKGLMVIQKNWLEIYHPWERWSTGQGELPPLEIGSRIVPSSLTMTEGRTSPPLPISEVELISLMDRNGIGTDATIAQHITTVQERSYAIKDANQKFLPTPLGIALVEGYNSMGYQLNKPDLRRELESECNKIAAGTKTKEDVIIAMIAKMKECYITATRDARKLDEAMARSFPRIGAGNQASQVIQRHFSQCGVCSSLMTLKQERMDRPTNGGNSNRNAGQGRRKLLLYCETCQDGWGLPLRGKVSPKTEEGNSGAALNCPICSFQVIQIKRGDGYDGNGYHVCPKCFSDPPIEYSGSADGRDFRCFECSHPTCSLASGTQGSEVDVFPCPFCNQNPGQVRLRKNSRGYVLSCSNYSGRDKCNYTIWLPKECQAVSIPDNNSSHCEVCSIGGKLVRKVAFVWKPGSVPPPLDRETTVCILCDTEFRQYMRISLPQANQVVPNARQRVGGGARAGRGGSSGRGNGGYSVHDNRNARSGDRCFKCGQSDHFANSCPQNGR